jgi:PAS domain S-box-containing protein
MQQADRHASQRRDDSGEHDSATRDLARALEQLSLVLSATGVGVWERDIAADKVTWSDTMHELFGLGREQFSGSPDEVLGCVHPEDRAVFRAGYEAAVRGDGDAFVQEFRIVRGDGEVRWVHRRGQVRREPDGRAHSVFGVVLDVTERKEREERIRFLMSEVLHRCLLAVVQAIVSQTARSATSPLAFAEDFSGRLKSLAASLDLLVRQDWRGVSVRDLVQSQLGHYCDPHSAQVALDGPDLLLSPAAAQYLGMALHELSINAFKHGALATPAGRVRVKWMLAGVRRRERQFHISWEESGGSPVEPPSTKGFGYLVIERMAAQALQGRATLEFPRGGLRWVLEADVAATVRDADR